MNIIFLSEAGLPKGMASSHFVLLVAKGLQYLDVKVKVVILSYNGGFFKGENLNTKRSGLAEGIPYEYATLMPMRARVKWLRVFQITWSFIFTSLMLIIKKLGGNLDAVLYYGDIKRNIFFYGFLCHLLKIPFAVFLVEWYQLPSKFIETSGIKGWFNRHLYDHVNGMVVVSHHLMENLHKDVHSHISNMPCLLIPVMVDPSAWRDIKPHHQDNPYMVYCADLDGYFEDALFCVSTLYRLPIKLDLTLVGSISQENKLRLTQYAETLNVVKNIRIIEGYLDDDELKSYFSGALALLAPLLENERSIARFPSKMADYLYSGRPIVTSKTGEIVYYLTDNQSGFLCNPGDIDDFASRIAQIIQDPDWANHIGANGYGIAKSQMDYKHQGKKILDFIKGLKT